MKEIVGRVRGRIVACEEIVERQNRTGIEIRLLAKLAPNLAHVTVVLLEVLLKSIEELVECWLIAGEVCADEVFENVARAVFLAPEISELFQAALNAFAL